VAAPGAHADQGQARPGRCGARRRRAGLLLLLALVACSPEVIYLPAEPEPEPPPAEIAAEAEDPVWVPEVGHVYVLDATDAIVADYAAVDAADYTWAVRAWGYNGELHNLIDDPAHPWHLVAGGPPG